jgi:hypothetical protein
MSPERARLSRKEAAAHMQVTTATFDKHIAPDLPVIRIGKLCFYMLADLEAWVDRQRRRKRQSTAA